MRKIINRIIRIFLIAVILLFIIVVLFKKDVVKFDNINNTPKIKRDKIESIILHEAAPYEVNSKDIPDINVGIKNLIDSTDSELYIESFYIKESTDKAIIDSLIKAAERNVKIKILLNKGDITDQYAKKLFKKYSNVEVRYFDVSQLGNRNYGILHCKYLISDNDKSFLSGANFSYTGMFENRDYGVYVKNVNIANSLKDIFYKDWNFNSEVSKSDSIPIHLNPDCFIIEGRPDQLDSSKIPDFDIIITKLIQSAKKTIKAELYLFSLSSDLHKLLRKAIKRGVEVKVIVDSYTALDPNWVSQKQALYKLKEIGVKIKIFHIAPLGISPRGMVHAKSIVVDSKKVIIGSNNWTNAGSLENREISIFIDNENIAGNVEKIFNKDWNFDKTGYGNQKLLLCDLDDINKVRTIKKFNYYYPDLKFKIDMYIDYRRYNLKDKFENESVKLALEYYPYYSENLKFYFIVADMSEALDVKKIVNILFPENNRIKELNQNTLNLDNGKILKVKRYKNKKFRYFLLGISDSFNQKLLDRLFDSLQKDIKIEN